jgi:hypothetical protein
MIWRNVTRVFLVINALLALVTAFNLAYDPGYIPAWLAYVILGGLGLFVAVTLLYVYELGYFAGAAMPRWNGHATIAWVLIVSSVVCTAALHQFWPFRPGIAEYWQRAEPILRYNFALTAGSLVLVVVLALLYYWRQRQAAVLGLVGLAAWMLVPNDACGNPFNRPWVNWLGASPLMFMPNSVVLLVGCCCLHGVRPRTSLGVMMLINGFVLLLGIAHIIGVW